MTKANDLERELDAFEEYIKQEPDTLEGITPGALPGVDAFEEYLQNGKTEKGN